MSQYIDAIEKINYYKAKRNKPINSINTPINGFAKLWGIFLFNPIFVINLPINPCGQTPQKTLPNVERVVTIKNGQKSPQKSPVVNRFSSFVGFIKPK